MPSGLTLTEEQMRSWIDQLNNAPPPNERLREIMRFAPIRTEEVYWTHDTVSYRTTQNIQVLRTRGVVQMSTVESAASWDGHEPEDL